MALVAGLRIGLYSPFKNALTQEGQEAGLLSKISAGMASGAVAAGVCNPTDLVKTRMQAGGAAQGAVAVTIQVVKAEGVGALWKGTTPSMVRLDLRLQNLRLYKYDYEFTLIICHSIEERQSYFVCVSLSL